MDCVAKIQPWPQHYLQCFTANLININKTDFDHLPLWSSESSFRVMFTDITLKLDGVWDGALEWKDSVWFQLKKDDDFGFM